MTKKKIRLSSSLVNWLNKKRKVGKGIPYALVNEKGFSKSSAKQIREAYFSNSYILDDKNGLNSNRSKKKSVCKKEKVENEGVKEVDKSILNEEEILKGSNIRIVGDFESGKGYVYNEDLDTYVVPLKSSPKHLVISGSKHRAIFQAYSNWNGNPATINQISRQFNLPRNYFEEYKRIFSITHDREPLSSEEILEDNLEDNVQKILEQKRFALHQKFQAEKWKEIESKAHKWDCFVEGQYHPFTEFLQTYKPSFDLANIKQKKIKKSNNDVFLVGLSDIHFGLKCDSRYTFRSNDHSSEKTFEIIEEYVSKIEQTIEDRNCSYKECCVACLGDILHGIKGRTQRGTELEYDKINDDQFDLAMDGLVLFFSKLLEIFPKVKVYSVRGNHDGVENYMLFKAIQSFFNKNSRIDFDVSSKRTMLFKIKDVLFLIDHGADDQYKAKIPSGGKKRESYIQSLLLAHPEKLIGVKQKVFVQGDLHHFENVEYNDFEFLMLSTPSVGDKYADRNNWASKPRQNCVVVGDDGIKENIHYYFQ